jgi:hypothetical protein
MLPLPGGKRKTAKRSKGEKNEEEKSIFIEKL